MKCFLCILLLFSCMVADSQQRRGSALPVSAPRPDKFIASLTMKVETETDLLSLIARIKQEFKTDKDRVRAAYFWVTDNIAYDCEGLKSGNMISGAIDAVKYKKAVCAGYTDLLCYFFREMDLEYGYVTGVARVSADEDFFMEPGRLLSNHAWNTVKIDNQWKLIDATWASGKVSNGSVFIKQTNEAYYLADPYFFIYNHLPDDTRWQLLKDTVITEEVFCNWPFIDSKFQMTGVSITPFYVTIKGVDGQPIEFRFRSHRKINKVYLSNDSYNIIETYDVQAGPEDGMYSFSVSQGAGNQIIYLGFGYEGKEGEESWGLYSVIGYQLIISAVK